MQQKVNMNDDDDVYEEDEGQLDQAITNQDIISAHTSPEFNKGFEQSHNLLSGHNNDLSNQYRHETITGDHLIKNYNSEVGNYEHLQFMS